MQLHLEDHAITWNGLKDHQRQIPAALMALQLFER
jgi:hypothetical protein